MPKLDLAQGAEGESGEFDGSSGIGDKKVRTASPREDIQSGSKVK